MSKWNFAIALGLGLLAVGLGRCAEPSRLVRPDVSHADPHYGHPCGATFWKWFCYHPTPLPRECRSCLSPVRSCSPPLYTYFLHRYPTTADIPSIGGVLGNPPPDR